MSFGLEDFQESTYLHDINFDCVDGDEVVYVYRFELADPVYARDSLFLQKVIFVQPAQHDLL